MPFVKVKKFNQITVPKQFSQALGIQEGDYVKLEREGNRLYIEPVEVIQKDLAFLWREKAKEMQTVKLSKDGEKMVTEALEDIERGRFKEFDRVEDFIKELGCVDEFGETPVVATSVAPA